MSFNCFKKVNGDYSIDVQSIKDLKSDLHMSHSKWQKYGLSLKKDVDYDAAIANTFEVSDKIKSEVLSKIPTELLNIEIPHVWYLEVTGSDDITSMIPPHIDSFRICTINYYISTNGETTQYYNYEPGIVKEIESFCSKDNECWILNTTIPHSVKLIPRKTRSILGASFLNTPYEKVISFFS
jgi:hypothetical protein